MKTIEELKRLSEEIIEQEKRLTERKEKLIREVLVELFNADGYEFLFQKEYYKDCSVDKLLEITSAELYANEICLYNCDDDKVLSISLSSSLEEQIKEKKEKFERIMKAREMKEREKELETLKRLKEKYESEKDYNRD